MSKRLNNNENSMEPLRPVVRSSPWLQLTILMSVLEPDKWRNPLAPQLYPEKALRPQPSREMPEPPPSRDLSPLAPQVAQAQPPQFQPQVSQAQPPLAQPQPQVSQPQAPQPQPQVSQPHASQMPQAQREQQK